jgi:hypothetical protein
MRRIAVMLATCGLVVAGAAPAFAAPHPSPVAPTHTGTACVAVLSHNPQTGLNAHSAPRARQNFSEVGAAFCGL